MQKHAAITSVLALIIVSCTAPTSPTGVHETVLVPEVPESDLDRAKEANKARKRNQGLAPKDGVMWRARIGLTTYRSTIHAHRGLIVVNSNGKDLKSTRDSQDGVYILNGLDGALVRHIEPPGKGERDANGIAIAGQRLYFGTDQGILYAYDFQGHLAWQRDLGGDIEAAPVLGDFNGDSAPDLAIGVEKGSFYVLDGLNGRDIHTLKTGQGSYRQRGYDATAAVLDINGDKAPEIFVPGRDNTMRAIDGRSGKELWKIQRTSGLRGAPILVDTNGDGARELIFSEAYSKVIVADPIKGTILWEKTLKHPRGGIEGLFSPLAWHPDWKCALTGTAWWRESEGMYCLDSKGVRWRHTVNKHNISSGVVIGDVDGEEGSEIIFGTESGQLLALDSKGQQVWSHEAGGPIECTPTLIDLDGDGFLEVVVASNDGFISAVRTSGRAPAQVGYYRGKSTNAGVF